MKHPPVLFLILILGTGCPPQPTPPITSNTGVCQAQLFFADINTQGKVVTNGNTLIFIDDQQVAGSSDTFSIDASNVSSKNQQPTTVSIYTYGMIRYRGRQERHLTFRFTYGNCNSIVVGWPYGIPPTQHPRGKSHRDSCSDPLMNRWARHERTLRTDPRGELIVSDRKIFFGTRARAKYQWDFRDIRSMSLDPTGFVLRITPVEGSEFTFDILDRAISPDLFDKISDCIFRQ